MRIGGVTRAALVLIAIGSISLAVNAQDHQHAMTGTASGQTDSRQLVTFPEPMRLHTITSMRDHLLALQEIDVALSQNAFDKAATIAEQRLGMSSLELHGAAHIAPFMPQGMQEIGTQMHPSGQSLCYRRTDGQREQRCSACASVARNRHATVCRLPRRVPATLIRL